MDIGQRIVVVGTTGSGKTTLASQLAGLLHIPHIELDALNWDPNWQAVTTPVFRDRVTLALNGEQWVVDGNYSKVRDAIWSRADTLVWLDYALPVILYRLVTRTIRRVVTREELWNGNRERLWEQLSKDSLILWALKTYRRRRREYPLLFQQPEYAHLQVIRFQSPTHTSQWVQRMSQVPL